MSETTLNQIKSFVYDYEVRRAFAIGIVLYIAALVMLARLHGVWLLEADIQSGALYAAFLCSLSYFYRNILKV